ncbi:MAG: hypothetical protein M1495_01070 [Bacteroidetes bacterium]|nr:hypothetical protein [Bacteroidota bacterium]MCL6097077.1 hypothetical protein [Bacteroidota bacterium]
MFRNVKNHIVEIISAVTLSALAVLYLLAENILLNFGISLKLSPQTILKLIFAILWLGLVTLALYLHEIYKHHLVVHCNLYWDKKKNPFCPSCKSPVSYYAEYKGTKCSLFYCPKCKVEIEATDVNGNILSMSEIQKRI